MTQRPGAFPDWATNNPAGVVQPSSAQASVGWVPGEPPAAQHANYLANTTSNWLRYLDEQGSSTVLASSLDFSTRLIGGGNWSYNVTTLAWNAPAYIAIPSAADADNTIAAASVSLPAGSVLYVTANMPFSTTASTTSGSTQLANVLYGDQAVVGQLVSGTGIPANTTVQTISSDGSTITLNNAATATATGVTVTFRSSGTLTPQVATSSSFVPGPNTVVFARGLGLTCIVGVGSGQMLLRGTESKILLGHGFAVTKTYTAGVAIGANMPVYLSPGASAGDAAGAVAGCVYPLDCGATSSQVRATMIGIVPVATAAGAPAEVVMQGITNGWNITPGLVYFGSPNSPGVYQVGPPTSPKQWIMPVGLAVSATQMYVLPRNGASQVRGDIFVGAVNTTGGAYIGGDTSITGNVSCSGTLTGGTSVSSPKFIAANGFRERIPVGNYYNVNYPGGDVQLTKFCYSVNGGTTALVNYPTVFDTAGSIISVVFTSDQSMNGAVLFYMRNIGGGGSDGGYEIIRSNFVIDGAVGSYGTFSTNTGVYTIGHITYAKNQIPVYPGQAYRAYAAYQNANVPFSLNVHVVVAYDA